MNMEARIDYSAGSEQLVAPERVCYEAHWRDQSVFLSAPCQSAREWQWHCLASAILLERLEDACVLAETMLDSSLQFFVSELPAQCAAKEKPHDGYLKVVLTRANDEVEIWLPARAHSQVAQHRDLIESAKLCWSDIEARVKIAQITLQDADVSRLMLGSLLLVPASWQAKWMCSVEVVQFDQSLNALIDPGNSKLVLSNKIVTNTIGTSDQSAHDRGLSVVHAYLNPPIKINPRLLLGSALAAQDIHTDASDISICLTQASCHCVVNEHPFSASLLPVGDGYGLCVTEY